MSEQSSGPFDNPILERQLLLQLGDRLRHLRKTQRKGTVELSEEVGITRNTLRAVEAGDPGPSMGTYLKVMSALGVAGDLALLAGDTLQPAPRGTAGARSGRARPAVQVLVAADTAGHQVEDLQSLVLHEAAVKAARRQPELVERAQLTLQRWLDGGQSRSTPLWLEWQGILRLRQWRRVLARTRRAQELRQASPLVTILTNEERQQILRLTKELKKGVTLGGQS